MKAFLEEYGFVILIAIVIILLIVMATPVGNSIKASILGLVDRFSGTATSKLDKADQGDFTANLRQAADKKAKVYLDVNSDSTTDQYEIIVTSVKGGKTQESVYTPANGSNPAKTEFLNVKSTAYYDFKNADSKNLNGTMEFDTTALGTPDDGSDLYITVRNKGTNEVVQSNTIKFHTIETGA